MRDLKEIQKIKNIMELAEVTQDSIAVKVNKSASLVSQVIRDRYPFVVPEKTIELVQSAINDAVGQNVFAKDGTGAKDGQSTTEGAGKGEVPRSTEQADASPDASNPLGG